MHHEFDPGEFKVKNPGLVFDREEGVILVYVNLLPPRSDSLFLHFSHEPVCLFGCDRPGGPLCLKLLESLFDITLHRTPAFHAKHG